MPLTNAKHDEDAEETKVDDDDDEEEIDSEEDGESKPSKNPVNKLKKRVKKAKKRVKNKLNRMLQFLIFALIIFLYLTFNFIQETVLPWFQGQEEVVITEKVIESDKCFKLVIETGESFCVEERIFRKVFEGETHYIWEDSYGVRRLEVKKNELEDFIE